MSDKKIDKYCFIHMKDEPVIYGNLTLLLFEYGLDRNEYFGKKFPFEVGGHLVYRKKMNRGTIAGKILSFIKNELNIDLENGNNYFVLEDEFSNIIRLWFYYSGGLFRVDKFECKTKDGHLIKTPLTIDRIERALNGRRK